MLQTDNSQCVAALPNMPVLLQISVTKRLRVLAISKRLCREIFLSYFQSKLTTSTGFEDLSAFCDSNQSILETLGLFWLLLAVANVSIWMLCSSGTDEKIK